VARTSSPEGGEHGEAVCGGVADVTLGGGRRAAGAGVDELQCILASDTVPRRVPPDAIGRAGSCMAPSRISSDSLLCSAPVRGVRARARTGAGALEKRLAVDFDHGAGQWEHGVELGEDAFDWRDDGRHPRAGSVQAMTLSGSSSGLVVVATDDRVDVEPVGEAAHEWSHHTLTHRVVRVVLPRAARCPSLSARVRGGSGR